MANRRPTDARGRLSSDPFSWSTAKDGSIAISRGGRVVVVVGGADAARLATRLASADERETQLLLAKATGNYRRGNER